METYWYENRWKQILQTPRTFLNQFFRDQTEGKPKFTDQNFENKSEQSLLIPSNGGFAKVPGLESMHLDLEKLFLLSVSNEHLNFIDINIEIECEIDIRTLTSHQVFGQILGQIFDQIFD